MKKNIVTIQQITRLNKAEKSFAKFLKIKRQHLTKKAKNLLAFYLNLYEYYDEEMDIESTILEKRFKDYFSSIDKLSNLNNIDLEKNIFTSLTERLKKKEINSTDYMIISEIIHRNNALRIEKYKQKSTDSYLVFGAKNRFGFKLEAIKLIERLKRELKKYDPDRIDGFILIYLDIDNLKEINDTCGHICGDRAIKKLGQTLLESIRFTDTCGHLHGDEFALFLNKTTLAKLTQEKEDRIAPLKRFKRKLDAIKIHTKKGDIQLTVSCGIVEFNVKQKIQLRDSSDFESLDSSTFFEDLLNQADLRLQEAKKHKKSGRESTILLPDNTLVKI